MTELIRFSQNGWLDLGSFLNATRSNWRMVGSGQQGLRTGTNHSTPTLGLQGVSNVTIENMVIGRGAHTPGANGDPLQIQLCNNILIKNCDIMFATDESLGIGGTTNITFEDCAILYALKQSSHSEDGGETIQIHSMGPLFANNGTTRGQNITMRRCLIAHTRARCPRLATLGPMLMENCVIYNSLANTDQGGSDLDGHLSYADYVGNWWIDGPDSDPDNNRAINANLSAERDARVYLLDNRSTHVPDAMTAQSELIHPDHASNFTVVETPHLYTGGAMSADDALPYVLANVGSWPRLALVKTVVGHVNNWLAQNGGPYGEIIDTESEVGGFPTLV